MTAILISFAIALVLNGAFFAIAARKTDVVSDLSYSLTFPVLAVVLLRDRPDRSPHPRGQGPRQTAGPRRSEVVLVTRGNVPADWTRQDDSEGWTMMRRLRQEARPGALRDAPGADQANTRARRTGEALLVEGAPPNPCAADLRARSCRPER